MGHNITAIVLRGKYDAEIAKQFDLIGIALQFDLSMFHIDHYYSACWQGKLSEEGFLHISNEGNKLFPSEIVLAHIMKKVSGQYNPHYAIIFTEYFGGAGFQDASVFIGSQNADININNINQALAFLGVTCVAGLDEFDTIGLSSYREQPDFLNKYVDSADELGL